MKVFLPIAPPVYSQQSIQRANYEISRAFEEADARYLSQGGGTIANVDPGAVPLRLEAGAGQAVALLEGVASDGTELFVINNAGTYRAGAASPFASGTSYGAVVAAPGFMAARRDDYGFVQVNSGGVLIDAAIADAAKVGVAVQAAASQTANLQEWQNSAGAVLAAVGANGNFRSAVPSVPASAAAAGSAGEIAWDADYFYVCVSSGAWKRAALSTW